MGRRSSYEGERKRGRIDERKITGEGMEGNTKENRESLECEIKILFHTLNNQNCE